MKNTMIQLLVGALAIGAASAASATVVQTFGANTLARHVTNAADFQANTTLSNDYVEDGLLFHYSGSGNNAGCGFEGFDCYDYPTDLSPAFSGNYMATNGTNAYVSVRKADLSDFYGIEFAAGSGYMNLNGYWQTLNNNLVTGSGNFSQPEGVVLALGDKAGFDEVRYFAFSSANKTSGFSAAAIDSVRVGDVPEPGSALLIGAGLLGLVGVRRKQQQG